MAENQPNKSAVTGWWGGKREEQDATVTTRTTTSYHHLLAERENTAAPEKVKSVRSEALPHWLIGGCMRRASPGGFVSSHSFIFGLMWRKTGIFCFI